MTEYTKTTTDNIALSGAGAGSALYLEVETITAGIKSAIQTAVPYAVVHGYERWAPRWEAVLGIMKTQYSKINGYMISRIQTVSRRNDYDERERAHVFRIRGFYGLDDSENTEATFQAQIEAIDNQFRADDETYGGLVTSIRPWFGPMTGLEGIQIDQVDARMFGNILCHYAELRLGVIE